MPFIGELSALVTAVCWSASSFAFTTAVKRLGTLQLNINRLIIAAIILFATIAVLGISIKLSESQIIYLSISGIVGFIFGDTFLFKAYQHIGARISMLLMSLSPIMSAILAYFFLKEVMNVLAIIGIVITIGGVALVVGKRNEIPASKYKISNIGIVYGLLSALGQAGGLIFAKAAFNEGNINGFVATFIRIVASVAFLFPVVVLTRQYKNPIKLFANDLKALRSTIMGTILGPYFGVTFSLIAVEYAKVGIAATLMATTPIIMLPISKYIYKENLDWQAVSGAILAVVGVALLFLK